MAMYENNYCFVCKVLIKYETNAVIIANTTVTDLVKDTHVAGLGSSTGANTQCNVFGLRSKVCSVRGFGIHVCTSGYRE